MFTTCYANRNEPDLAMDLCAVFEHNSITVDVAAKERCCGMPRLELGDLEKVAEYKAVNIPSSRDSSTRASTSWHPSPRVC